jgi:hypothetical protein
MQQRSWVKWMAMVTIHSASAFVLNSSTGLVSTTSRPVYSQDVTDEMAASETRRKVLQSSMSFAVVLGTSSSDANAINLNPFVPEDQISTNHGLPQPAKRATAYLVDSTIPPTLVPFKASREAAILKQIGSGLGTRKSPYIEEELNLNNFMNKGVFGAIDFIKNVIGDENVSSSKNAAGQSNSASNKKTNFDASFVFLGMDYNDTSGQDATLATSIMTDIIKPRRDLDTAIALDYIPLSLQYALDEYISSSSDSTSIMLDKLTSTLINNNVPSNIVAQQLPIFELAKSKNIKLIACSPEYVDITTVRQEGIQNVNQERRSNYVVDSAGFIEWTQDPKNRMYTDKSLLKDFVPLDQKDAPANFFGERILVHESISTTIAKYAVSHPKTCVIAISQIKDVRFMGGPNGRIVRICKAINPSMTVDEDAVTTILINPSAEETLSQSKFLRLEIGTAPNLLQYQTKIADYLWFSTMPKVNMLPRLMNGY